MKRNGGYFGGDLGIISGLGIILGLGSLRTLYSTSKQAIIAVLIKCIYCFYIKLQNFITNRIHFNTCSSKREMGVSSSDVFFLQVGWGGGVISGS